MIFINFQLKCCGAQEYKDWTNTTFAQASNSVPDSCCVSDVEGCGNGILSMDEAQVIRYRNSQKHKSTLLHTYVLNQFLTAERSCTTKYFFKNSYRIWQVTSLRFFLHLLRPNWSIFGGIVSLFGKMFENGKIAVFEGK